MDENYTKGNPEPGNYPGQPEEPQTPTTVYIMINGSTVVEKYDTTALNISISITSTGCSIVVGSSSYTWTYSGTATFAGLSTTNGATVPDSGFAVGDTYTTSIAAQGSYAPSFYSVDTVLPIQYITTDEELISIANAIRSKGGTSAVLEYPAEFISAIGAIQLGTPKAAQTYHPSTSDQTIASGYLLIGNQTFKAVELSNTLTAANIKSGITVAVGDSNNASRIASITGSYEGSGGEGIPSNLAAFAIDNGSTASFENTIHTYFFETGMTWGQFIASTYNTNGIFSYDGDGKTETVTWGGSTIYYGYPPGTLTASHTVYASNHYHK